MTLRRATGNAPLGAFAIACSLVTIAFLLVASAGCGVKAPPRPPEDTIARAPTNLRVTRVKAGMRLGWKRPDHSADGRRLSDLAGFIIERRDQSGAFVPLVTIPADDPDRLRPKRRYEYIDPGVRSAATAYRVRALARDGQWGQPSPPAAAGAPANAEP